MPENTTVKPRKLILAGMSGAGKSSAMAILEDMGFYCIYNMPVNLLPSLMQLPGVLKGVKGIALSTDVREHDFMVSYEAVLEELHKQGHDFEIIFLTAGEGALARRFSESRRPHPFPDDKGLLESIRHEKKYLEGVLKKANIVIDTTDTSTRQFKVLLTELFGQDVTSPLQIYLTSFGFKYGLPKDADLVMDVRFIDNPYFVPELRDLTGNHAQVRDFVLNQPETREFLQKYLDLLEYLLPLYTKEGKSRLTIAVGCTGGRHRSVAVTNYLADRIRFHRHKVIETHRDIER